MPLVLGENIEQVWVECPGADDSYLIRYTSPEKLNELVMGKTLHKAEADTWDWIIVDWSNVVLPGKAAGKVAPCNKKNKLILSGHPKRRNWLLEQCMQSGNFGYPTDMEIKKN